MSEDSVDLEALSRGDKQAWDRFVKRYARVVFAAVQNRLGRSARPDEVADAVPEGRLAVEPRLPAKVRIPAGLLSPRQALVLELLYRRDLEVADAAEIMGVGRQTVRSMHHKALVKLRTHSAAMTRKLGDEGRQVRVSWAAEESEEQMSEGNKKAADGPALWERARVSTLETLAGEAPTIDEGDLAAYLDGGLDAADCARIEAALASHGDKLELLAAARQALEAEPAPETMVAPEAIVARAQALAPEPRAPARIWAVRPGAWLASRTGALLEPARGLAFAGVAAGFMAISVAGFELGRAEVDYSTQIDGLLAQDFVNLFERGGEDLL